MYKCVYWLEPFLRWAMWPMDILLGHVVKLKLLVFITCVFYSAHVSYDLFAQWFRISFDLQVAWSMWRSNWQSSSKCLNILWALCLILTKLDTCIASRNYIPFDFQIKWLKVSQNWNMTDWFVLYSRGFLI